VANAKGTKLAPERIMFFNLMGTWIRGVIAIGLVVAGIVLVKEWADELPTRERVRDAASGAEVTRPLQSLPERVAAWKPGPDRPTVLLGLGMLAILLTLFGRQVSPLLWRKGERDEPRPGGDSGTHRLKTGHGYFIHVDMHGSPNSPALVLVHGVGSDRTQWQEAIADLSDRFHVFAFDLLGHGRSDRDARAEHSIEAAARDLNDVISFTKADRIVLAGHSMGGQVVMEWCLAHPGRLSKVTAIVLVHTTPQNPFETMAPTSLNRALKGLHELALRMTPPLSWIVRVTNRLDYLNGMSHWGNDLAMFGGKESRQQLERTAQLHARMDPGAVARFALSMTRFRRADDLSTLDVRTIVIAAAQDPVTVVEASRDIVRRIPGAELVVLKDTRHMGFMERRQEFADVVSRLAEPHAKGQQPAA
jgi:pimeloyl-ACP methyl ester carboxylesterase